MYYVLFQSLMDFVLYSFTVVPVNWVNIELTITHTHKSPNDKEFNIKLVPEFAPLDRRLSLNWVKFIP